MKIAQYLIELLYQREAVILPGFGEFSATPGDATASGKGKLTPPAKTLSFNPSVKANDYVLAKFVAEKESVSITRGNEMIREYVDEVNQTLDSRNEVSIPGLGNFSYQGGDRNMLMFNEDTTHSFDPSSFGLTTAYVDGSTEVEPESEPETRAFADQIQEVPETVAEPVTITDLPERKRKRRRYIWLIILVLFLSTAAALGVIYQNVVAEYALIAGEKISSLVKTPEKADDKLSPHEKPTSEEIPAIVDKEEPPAPEESIDEITPEIPAQTPELKEYTPSKEDNYLIIAGCFGDKTNAEKMAEKLIGEGFSQATIDGKTSSGLYRVASGFYSSNEEAVKALSKAKSDGKLRNAWITKR